MGGECNYLLRVKSDYHLEFVPGELWKTQDMQEWAEGDVDKLLQDAETALVSAADRLQLPVQLIRKPRAVGVVPTEPTIYEVIALHAARTVSKAAVSFVGQRAPWV